MLRALDEFVIEGPPTLLGFHRALLSHPCFVEGATCHGIVESEMLAQQAEQLSHQKTTRSSLAGRRSPCRGSERSRSTDASSP